MAVGTVGRVGRKLARFFRKVRAAAPDSSPDDIRFVGDYQSWKAATIECCGYEASHIADRVLQATCGVLRGDFAYERDSVGFTAPDFNWSVLSCLMHAAAAGRGALSVLDFGGSLGSTFLQHRKFFEGLTGVDWRVVEQVSFVERGKEILSKFPRLNGLTFHSSVDAALEAGNVDVLLLGSVLQYLEDPFAELQSLLGYGFRWIVLDRTAVLRGDSSGLLTVQHVPATVYEARYPAWFISHDCLMQQFQESYELLAEWRCSDSYAVSRGKSDFIGCCFRRIAEGGL